MTIRLRRCLEYTTKRRRAYINACSVVLFYNEPRRSTNNKTNHSDCQAATGLNDDDDEATFIGRVRVRRDRTKAPIVSINRIGCSYKALVGGCIRVCLCVSVCLLIGWSRLHMRVSALGQMPHSEWYCGQDINENMVSQSIKYT